MQTTIRPAEVNVLPHAHGYSVEPAWAGVDRPCTGGIVLRRRKDAERLAAAMRDGAWFTSAEVATDVNGKTYVQATGQTIGKYALAALTNLGY